ncbi:MAG TPA: DNA-formamidopyrimidine glycosylase family protein [Burkholderiales bacterium]|nr:DNA-formamidopyrimidine glycosylase family protein [Burkholderiales bacterium]
MPELPDITLYIEALEARIVGQRLERVQLLDPFVLRSVDPPVSAAPGKRVLALRRIGKRIVLELEGELFAVLHLMVAGRLLWVAPGAKVPPRRRLAVFEFSSGQLVLTEAGTRRRASLHIVHGEANLKRLDPGGLDVLQADLAAFSARLTADNHTLKRALTDPHILSGIGNAYSDEILHCAKLSPVALTSRLSQEEMARLYQATQQTLTEWTQRLRQETGDAFPAKVTAFRDGMAVHGRYRQPCPVCGAPVQRIVYADNETNYCARCQTGGRVLADRTLSRLLKKSWPRDIDELD